MPISKEKVNEDEVCNPQRLVLKSTNPALHCALSWVTMGVFLNEKARIPADFAYV